MDKTLVINRKDNKHKENLQQINSIFKKCIGASKIQPFRNQGIKKSVNGKHCISVNKVILN